MRLCKQMSARKSNVYVLDGEYGIGFTTNTNRKFFFDKEDYERIKGYCWYENSVGYIITTVKRKCILLHRLIMDVVDTTYPIIDHINNDKLDNRKANLRLADKKQNGINRSYNRNNKLGVKGVYFSKREKKYRAHISKDRHHMDLGGYDNIEDAIRARRKKEVELFGEYAYCQST